MKIQWMQGVLLSLCAFTSFAENIAAIEENANRRAALYANEIQQLSETIMKSEKSGEVAQLTNEIAQTVRHDEPITTHLKKVSQVLVFLSFSMPEKSLHAWLLQCKTSGATPVIRGLIHNSFKETMQVIQRLSQTTGVGMQLDPILFKTFEITKVPAVIYVKDAPICSANMNCKPITYDRLYGDVTLDYALEKMLGDGTTDATLDAMMHQLRGALA